MIYTLWEKFMKKCSICELEKDDVGNHGKCRPCNAEYMRQYKLKNKDKIIKYQQKYDANYYQENKKAILSEKKKYYLDNKIDILEKIKKYSQENQEKIIEYRSEEHTSE